MQKKTKSRLVSVLFVVICCTVFASSLYLFWRDLNAFTVREDKDRIATITYKQNIAQRKFNDRVVWERLQQQSPLYEADTIRTSEGSSAIISFDENSAEVNVGENTMVQIFKGKDGSVNISVDGGNVTVDTTNVVAEEKKDIFGRTQTSSPAVKVKMENGSTFSLEKGSRVTASSTSEGENVFVLQEGKASVVNEKKEETSIKKGESVKVEKSGSLVKNQITVTSISKDLKILNVADKSKDVVLEWKTTPELESKKIVVETSRDKNFSKIDDRFEKQGTSSVTVKTTQGEVFWRVYSPEDKNTTVTGRIDAVKVGKAKLLTPTENSVITFRKKKPMVGFSWQGNSYADSYKVEVFNRGDFSKPVLVKDVKGERLNVTFPKEGSYGWKVTPHYPLNEEGYAGESETGWFEIARLPADERPSIQLPADNVKYTLSDKNTAFNFSWKSYTDDADFTLVVSSSQDFSSTVLTESTKAFRISKEFNISTLSAGTYYWKVLRRSPEDENGRSESETRKFTVVKYVPGVIKLSFPPAHFAAEKAKFNTAEFAWKMPEEYKGSNYTAIVQFSRSKNFEKIEKEINTDSSKISMPELSEGTYFWRVAAKNVNTDKYETVSEIRNFQILGELNPPVISASLKKEQILNSSNSFSVNWSKAANADYYSVKLFDENNGVIGQTTTAQTHVVFKVPALEEDKKVNCRVSIQSVAEETALSPIRISKAAAASVTVRSAVPVKLLTQKNGTKNDGLTALRTPVVLKFEKGDEYTGAVLTVRKIQANGTSKVIAEVKNPKSSTSLKRLSAGSYQWSVSATDYLGNDLSSRENGSFTVTEVAPLILPVLVNPENRYVINANYLKNNRFIEFDWNDVSDATDYRFVLYERSSEGKLIKVYEEKTKDSRLKFKELKKLDIKNYEWRVTAYCHAADGFEERRSPVAASRFTVKFDLPSKIKTIDPGVQYAD